MRAPLTPPALGVLGAALAVGPLLRDRTGPVMVPPAEVVVEEAPDDAPTLAPSPGGEVVAPPSPVTDGVGTPERAGSEGEGGVPSPTVPDRGPTHEDGDREEREEDHDCDEDDDDD